MEFANGRLIVRSELDGQSEQDDRERVMSEMERHSRLSTATQPINEHLPSSVTPSKIITASQLEETGSLELR